MKLLTKSLESKLPALYATENEKVENKTAVVKYFNTWGIGTWYGVEYDPVERVFFGYVDLHEKEWGYFSLDELESIPTIERDLYFEPTLMKRIPEFGR